MELKINNKQFHLPDGLSVLSAIEYAKESIPTPELGKFRDWIHNTSCPLLGLAEINGKLASLPILKKRLVENGMIIETMSPKVKAALVNRTNMLLESHDCFFMRKWKEKNGSEGMNACSNNQEDCEEFPFPKTVRLSIFHDPNTCILCKACVDTCFHQGVEALRFDDEKGVLIDENQCIGCGQCILRCPMGAINKNNELAEFLNCQTCAFTKRAGAMHEFDTFNAWNLLNSPQFYCVAEFDPAVFTFLVEEFSVPTNEMAFGKIFAALRRLGFKKVWAPSFAADLTIMEEGTEFIERLTKGGVLPMFTSCCPSWIRFAERFYPELVAHLSTAKSPQQMFGAIAKTFGAESLNIKPEFIRVISIMPCSPKKVEASRPEMNSASKYWQYRDGFNRNFQDVDVVITAQELVRLIKLAGIDLYSLPEEKPDFLLNDYTGADTTSGPTNCVIEPTLKTVITMLSGTVPSKFESGFLAGADGIKRLEILLGDKTIKVAVACGLANFHDVCKSILAGGEFSKYQLIEFMACPGGCTSERGKTLPANVCDIKECTVGLNCDTKTTCQPSNENPEIKILYDEFLEKPLSSIARELLHTSYNRCSLFNIT